MTYQIQARCILMRDGWTSSVGVPTFFLHSGIQGITSAEHAASIARGVVDPDYTHEVHLTSYCEETGDYHAASFKVGAK